jgi:hypothetical protein
MGTFAEAAIVDYCLLLGKQNLVSGFRLQQAKEDSQFIFLQ